MKLWTKQGRGVVLDFSWRGGVDLDFSVSFRGLSPCAAERGGEGNKLFLAILGRVFGLLAGLARVEIWSLV